MTGELTYLKRDITETSPNIASIQDIYTPREKENNTQILTHKLLLKTCRTSKIC